MVITRASEKDGSAQASTSTQTSTSALPTAMPTKATTSVQPSVLDGRSLPSPSLNILSILEEDINKLSEEGKSIVGVIIKAVQAMSDKKNQIINQLENKVVILENKLYDLENHVDDINQYERRDTIIVNGASLPKETVKENTADVFISAVKNNLNINISQTDFNVAHRIGNSSRQNTNNPIKVRLQSRQKKNKKLSMLVLQSDQSYT